MKQYQCMGWDYILSRLDIGEAANRLLERQVPARDVVRDVGDCFTEKMLPGCSKSLIILALPG